jgi:outer membrane immunogenic protein
LGATGIAGSGVSSNKTATGWVAGGGIEYALAPAVSVKAEYLHIDLGSTAINHPFSAASNVSASLTTHHDYDVVRGGVNYHLGENAPLGAAADIFAGFFNDSPGYALNRWSGFYAGWNSGSAWSEHQASLGVTAYQNGSLPVSSGAEYSPSGALGGGQIGFNWQQGRLVFGVEADADWSGVVDKGAAVAGTVPTLLPTSAAAATAKSELEYFGTLRGRAGYTFGRALIYGSGGFATGSVKDELSITNNASSGNATSAGSLSNSRTATGWAAGAGIEFALTPSWSLKTEYLHMDLGSTTVSQSAAAVPGSFSALANLTVHHDYDIVRGGWNYRLGTYEPLK